jgi:ribosomal protein L11 methyltransferase
VNDRSEWYEIAIHLPIDAVDDVSAQLAEAFYGNSLALELPAEVTEQGDSASVAGTAILRGYIAAGGRSAGHLAAVERTLWHLRQTGVPIDHSVRPLTSDEWLTSWKSFYKPVRIGRICIVPAWESATHEPHKTLVIEPGMAFGTGLHPTTQLCLRLLQEVPLEGTYCLDLGTGSGILAIAAALLGASRVLALDLDPMAVDAALGNVARNNVADRVTVAKGTLPVPEAFDVVAANISSGYFLENAHLLRQALKTDGLTIASGMTEERVDEVLIALAAAGLRPIRLEQQNDWVAILARSQ